MFVVVVRRRSCECLSGWLGSAQRWGGGRREMRWRPQGEREEKEREETRIDGRGRRRCGKGGKDKAQRGCGRVHEGGWIGCWKLLEEVVERRQC